MIFGCWCCCCCCTDLACVIIFIYWPTDKRTAQNMLSCCRTTQALRFKKTCLSHDSLPKASSITAFQFATNTIHNRALQHKHFVSKLQDISVSTQAWQKQLCYVQGAHHLHRWSWMARSEQPVCVEAQSRHRQQQPSCLYVAACWALPKENSGLMVDLWMLAAALSS